MKILSSDNSNKIVLVDVADCSLEQIFECGQCFRWNKIGPDTYFGVAYNKPLIVKQLSKTRIELHTNDYDFKNLWYHYFDFARDYEQVKSRIQYDKFMREATEYGWGIRILKQEPWETLCSFIISQRNNIPKIKSTIDRLCKQCGDKIDFEGQTSYTFPTPEAIVEKLGYAGLVKIGLGYRAEYIYQATRLINNGEYNLYNLKNLGSVRAEIELLKLYGVGPKVANCVMLFGLNYVDAFPIDVWMQRIIDDIYGGSLDIRPFKDVAGIVQQYMFYYIRSQK